MYKELLDTLVVPIVFCDLNHVIVYMNEAAGEKYKKRGGMSILGNSIFDCHKESSNIVIREIFGRMQAGLNEQITRDTDKIKIFMCAVRNELGELIGYYERYEHFE
ncbi:MAG: PAS domain-containing protein [Clostridia bacterium]|jgi:hypothetical protein|nr:PAS domain-containing protein [Clostridia bacterium]